ncbi:MAG: HlyD family efflux transporter periplasmic adaptor subunit [Planctomycetota bacterium]|nr:HlyD family efflux transporter periplasmic adaptor subunit [Planctomycetota bacterium]
MRGDTSSPQIDGSDEAWSEIETLVDETAKLARMPMSSHEFHSELVKRLVQATNAHSAAVWCRDKNERFSIEAQIESPHDVHGNASLLATRSQNVVEVARTRQTAALSPHQSDVKLRNPTDDALVLQPAGVDEQIVAVVETFHGDVASPNEARNTEQVVSVFTDLVAEFHRNCQLRELRHRDAAWSELEQFADQVHRSLDLKRTAFAIANEAARVTGCDRVMVFRGREEGCRTLAISGLDTFDRRSTQIRAAERLAKAVASIDEPLWHAGELQALPSQLELRLQSHLDSSHVRSLAVVPLGKTRDSNARDSAGVLLFERFEDVSWGDSQRRRIEFVCRQGAIALQNANELAGLPLIGASRLVQRCLSLFALRHLPKTAAVLCLLAAAIAALVLVPADFEIQGEGRLMPTSYRHMFAPADGVIEEIYVDHAELVTAGAPLLKLRRADLDYDEARLIGEMLTNQKRLKSVSSWILNHKSASASSAAELDELTSEEARLEILLNSLREQQAILARERADLAIASPIDGEVLTWGIEDVLSLRPVVRGERLLSVADPNGPWQIELQVADHDIEYVLAARRELKELKVNFILTSHAGEGYSGTVEEIAIATELDEHDQLTVLVRVAVDRDQLPDLRPGARVVANVHCGRRSIGYVWLRELFEVIKMRLLF